MLHFVILFKFDSTFSTSSALAGCHYFKLSLYQLIVNGEEMKLFYGLEYFISSRVDKTDPHRQFAAPFKAANF